MPSGKASRVDLEAYAQEFVTPVLGHMIENIMEDQPQDMAQYIVKYLTQKDTVAKAAKHWDDMANEIVALKRGGAVATDAPAPAPSTVVVSSSGGVEIPMATFAAISTALDPYEAQERIIAEACGLLKCDRASIFLVRASTRPSRRRALPRRTALSKPPRAAGG